MYQALACFLSFLVLGQCAPPSTCNSRANCSFNGECNGGVCDCIPQFKGERCDVFNFLPVNTVRGSGLRSVNVSTGEQVSSWGGSVLLGEDGSFHMWAAEMTYSTGIKSWRSNSRIVHAVAHPNSSKPFEFLRKDVAQPVFAHEPTVARAPTGEFVMCKRPFMKNIVRMLLLTHQLTMLQSLQPILAKNLAVSVAQV
jgi:hypothetical protein